MGSPGDGLCNGAPCSFFLLAGEVEKKIHRVCKKASVGRSPEIILYFEKHTHQEHTGHRVDDKGRWMVHRRIQISFLRNPRAETDNS